MVSARAPTPIDPVEVSTWAEAEALEQLDLWESVIPARTFEEIPEQRDAEAVVLGDTHGDWPTTRLLVDRYLHGPRARARWIALGDYVDRTPRGLPQGSLRNALYVLSLRAALPERVTLLRGNHETQRQMPAGMHALQDESRELWGSTTVAERTQDLFDRLPLAARTQSGLYLAHAGFPMGGDGPLADSFREISERLLSEVVWNDVEGSPACGHRGIDQEPIRAGNLASFLARSDSDALLRGHDPDIAGTLLFEGRLLTVHGSRVFSAAGLTTATVPLGGRVRRLTPSMLERLEFPPLPARRR